MAAGLIAALCKAQTLVAPSAERSAAAAAPTSAQALARQSVAIEVY
jgi:hypothetical protein